MKKVVCLVLVCVLAAWAQATVIEDFESGFSGSWSNVHGQNGWQEFSGSAGLWADTGGVYSINNNSMYAHGTTSTAAKSYAAAGIASCNDGDIVSALIKPVENTWNGVLGGYSITASTNVNAGSGLSIVIKNNGNNQGEFYAWVNAGEIPLSLPLAGMNQVYRIEVEMDFTNQQATIYGENLDAGSGRVSSGPHAFTWGSAVDVAALGGVMFGGGNYMVDDVEYTVIPEPVSVVLLCLGGLVLRRRK